MPSLRSIAAILLLGRALLTPLAAAAFDTVVFGDVASESEHAFSATATEIIAGALGEPARRALPLDPVDYHGGSITVTMAVDPLRRNYFSIKLWGEDATDQHVGRLYLNVLDGGNEYQVGFRHEGDYMPLSVAATKQALPGRFFYSTTMLPLAMTRGKTSLTVKIASMGRLYGLGQGGEKDGGNYQFLMDLPGRGIYRAYTHVEPFLDPAGEVQGSAPVTTVRPSPGAETIAPGGVFHNRVTNRINGLLNATATTGFATGDVAYLARAYSVPQVAADSNKPAVVDKVAAVIDAYAAAWYDGTVSAGGWGGSFGELGRAVHLLAVPLAGRFDDEVAYGSGGTKTRREAWGDLFFASRESGRFNRQTLTNQNFIGSTNIYYANRGLLVLGDARAFPETDARRYLREACGLDPWRGSDLAGGGQDFRFGPAYRQVTEKGLTREWGYVGNGYGEMAHYAADYFRATGDAAFLAQAVKMARARAPFRRPAIEVSGSNRYRTMEGIGLLAWRGAGESDGEYANPMAYAGKGEWGEGMRVAAASLDPVLVGYAKQMLADGQYFSTLTSASNYANDLRALDVFADYPVVDAAADPGHRLPMTDGQPDFAWADEENGVMAIKHGSDRLWVAPYWQAKTGTGINAVARFHFSATAYDQYGVLETVPQFVAGGYFTRTTTDIDKPEGFQWMPPSPRPLQAYGGEILPLGVVPAGAWGDAPFRGRANYYAFRFGRYLIGMNAGTTARDLVLPAGSGTVTDLVSGNAAAVPVSVRPRSTVALVLPSATDPAPVPGTPLVLRATGSAAAIDLQWSAASGGDSYTVKRATSVAGPFVAVATAGTGTTWQDTGVTAGASYHYKISAVNAHGEGYDSMRASVSAGLPPPWDHADIGNVGTAGGANFRSGVFSLEGAGSDIGGTSDSFHFAWLPLSGTGTLVARLTSAITGKCGVAMRESLAPGSRSVAAILDHQMDTARMPVRTGTGGNTTWTNGPAAAPPRWLRLERSGNTFTSASSPDGINWTVIGSVNLTMPDPIVAGLAVCSRNTGSATFADFDHVSLNGTLYQTPPDAPESVSATAGQGSIALAWEPVAGATTYQVKRSVGNGGPFTVIASGLITPSFTDSGLGSAITCTYTVSATNAAGTGPESPPVSATAQASPPEADVIGFNFAPAGNTVMTPADFAGAPGARFVNWNPFSGGTLATGIIDGAGDPVGGISVSLTNGNGAFGDRGGAAGNDLSMFRTVFDKYDGTPATLTVTGIPFASYDVLFYLYGDESAAGANDRGGRISVGASTYYVRTGTATRVTAADGSGYQLSSDTTLGTGMDVQLGNHVRFTGLSGDLTATMNAENINGGALRLKISGFQIVAHVDPPLTAAEQWRLTHFGTASNSGDAADGADPDGDESTNADEFVAGTDPKLATSVFKITGIQAAGGSVIISFPGIAGKTYRIERSETLAVGSWVEVQANLAGTGSLLIVTDDTPPAGGKGFYRGVVQSP